MLGVILGRVAVSSRVSVAGCLGYDVLANIDRSSFNRSQFQLLVV